MYTMQDFVEQRIGVETGDKLNSAMEKPEPKHVITIVCDGTTTTASLKAGGKVVKTAHAKRNPADRFSLRRGATLALLRLLAEKEKPRPFCLGDRVVYTDAIMSPHIYGKHGRVVRIDHAHGTNNICVEYDKDIGGHDCGGEGKDGHCWWCFAKWLRHER